MPSIYITVTASRLVALCVKWIFVKFGQLFRHFSLLLIKKTGPSSYNLAANTTCVLLPLSFPPVKAPLKVPPPPASPSGISSRLIEALGMGCLYTLNTWPPSLSSTGLVSTKASSNRNTCRRWQEEAHTHTKWEIWLYENIYHNIQTHIRKISVKSPIIQIQDDM